MSRKKLVLKDGKFVESNKTNKTVASHLRKLPADHVTDDIGDPDRVHALDAPHIVDAVSTDRFKAELNPEKEDLGKELLKRHTYVPGTGAKVNQFDIDIHRMLTIRNLITSAARAKDPLILLNPNGQPRIRHLWYPEDNLDKVKLREGNPPADVDRPKHLRRLELAVDCFDWPRQIADDLVKKGVEVPELMSAKEMLQ